MRLLPKFKCQVLFFLIWTLSAAPGAFSGVSRAIQDQYKRDYENKAVFLKIPVYSERQFVRISDQKFRAEQGLGAPKYKVGDQLRVLNVDFSNDEIKLRMGAIDAAAFVEIIFKFDANLLDGFPNRDVFDRALQSTFTEGLKYKDIEDAKLSFFEQEFERFVREIAVSASTNREAVLRSIAPQVPAYQDAQRDIENIKSRLQDVSEQLKQSQAENRKLDVNQKNQQAELSRLKSANAALQDKIDNFTSQVSRLGDDLRDARGAAQGYQQEIANIQRSLNIKVDSGRDPASQISDLGQAIRRLQKDNEGLTHQIASTRTGLEAQQAANARLVADNEELKSNNRQMQDTIKTLTSNENSLQKKYFDLEKAKKRLDEFSQVVQSLQTRIVEEKSEGGVRSGKANIYLKSVLLGSLDWRLPAGIRLNESRTGEVAFSAESIDSVRLTPEERSMLRTLGERLKVRIDLIPGSEKMQAAAQEKESLREIGERERSTWKWTIGNKGSRDARLLISARLVNKNSQEISFFEQENAVLASNLVRQVRGYLQPIPLGVGAAIGFLIFGVVGIFRKPRPFQKRPSDPAAPLPNANRKEL